MKILAIVLLLTITLMLIAPIASAGATGIPNPDTITYATIGGPDATGGSDPAWAYDTSSEMMLMQTYEPLFMYANTSLTTFIPLLADSWPGSSGVPSGFVTPINDNSAGRTLLHNTYGITPPAWANQTWVFHIRKNVLWQDSAHYGNVTPDDVVYSIQRGLLMDAISGVQWMMYGPLLGAGSSGNWANSTTGIVEEKNYNGVFTGASASDSVGLGDAVRTCVMANDTTGYVAFNLIAPYVPFMQILTQGWAFVTCKAWVEHYGGINTAIALSNGAGNYSEFTSHYQPPVSPLMNAYPTGPIGAPDGFNMMGSGPYLLKVYNTDPHTGFQYFQKFDSYWQGWPAPGSASFSKYVNIKIVEEWSNRKFQFLSTSSTQADLTDVPRANCAELHTAGKDSTPLPGISLTKILQQLADYYYFNYLVGAGSAFFPTWGNGTQCPTLFSDRDLREAFMYCFNDSQFLIQYFLGEAVQPSTFMCNGTAYYNGTVPVRQYNIAKAIEHFKAAWGGQVWSQGITVKLVYNIGNLARQTIATMISDAVQRIDTLYSNISLNLNVVPDGEPWGTYLPAMQHHQLSCFTVGWLADYPDPDDWAVPFMSPTAGAYAHSGQKITYGLNTTSLNAAYVEASPKLTWGPIPYASSNPVLGEVTGLNNSYVDNLIFSAPGASTTDSDPGSRSKIYNELMDIFYAEGGAMPTDQGVGRHYERDWIHGWIGQYSANAVAPGDYFYQMWKAPPTGSTPIYGVNLDATHSITNTSIVYHYMQNSAGNMTYSDAQAIIDYTCSAKYTNTSVSAPVTIYATLGLKRFDPWTNRTLYVSVGTFTIARGGTTTWLTNWNETTTAENGTWVISFRAEPIGTAGGEVYPSNPALLEIGSPYGARVGNDSTVQVFPAKFGDIGKRVGSTNTFGVFDGAVTSTDLALFLQCYKALAPAADMYLADLGSRQGSTNYFFAYDSHITSTDLALFLICYKGTGP